MNAELTQLQADTLDALQHAQDAAAVDALEISVLGRKGKLAALLSRIPSLPPAERAGIGTLASDVKRDLHEAFTAKRSTFSVPSSTFSDFDPTWPGVAPSIGHLHPVNAFLEHSVQFFSTLGYAVADGPEVETASYNFDKLNIQRTIRPATCGTPTTSTPSVTAFSCARTRRQSRFGTWRRTSRQRT